MPKKQNLQELLAAANNVHGDKYDYSLITEYKGINAVYPIICPEHGVFYKTLNKHIYTKQGCPFCSKRFRYDTETFIEAAKKLQHCQNYSFDKVKYVNNKTKITVTCKDHGDFDITPGHLFSGEGCPVCRYIKSSNSNRRCIDDVIDEAKHVHGDKYDYSLIKEYKNDRTKYPIICPEHGVFYQTMNNHIIGAQGCPICARNKSSNNRKIGFEAWEETAKIIHNNKYTYHKETYNGIEEKTLITCPKHGDFWQKANNHTNLRQGCPKCGHLVSSAETEIAEFVKSIGCNVETSKRFKDFGEIDVYIPEHKLGIEYNGLYWHCELSKDKSYHLNKTLSAEKNGIKLFHVFEDEWMYKREIIKSMICNQVGVTDNRIYARKCYIKELTTSEAKEFLNSNHLQGYCPSSVRVGLYNGNELVSVMTFGLSRHFIGNKRYQYELLRFANKINTSVVGGASKLFKYFINKVQPDSVVSYADRRWSSGSLYCKLGFKLYNISKPSYYYIINNRRVYRFNMRKNILMKKYRCPVDMTERQFCYNNKWYRIYDCGCLCYVYNSCNEV